MVVIALDQFAEPAEEVCGSVAIDAPSPLGLDQNVSDLVPEDAGNDALLANELLCNGIGPRASRFAGETPCCRDGGVDDDGHSGAALVTGLQHLLEGHGALPVTLGEHRGHDGLTPRTLAGSGNLPGGVL
ncbi:MAG: hypothetical protein F4X76_07080 [Chloroflexi bacterium]|nr:hypothetical protein [Chloroflexota bacterium]